MRLSRRSRALQHWAQQATIVLCVAVALAAHPAELVVVGFSADTTGLQREASSWETATGNRLIWLAPESSSGAAADVLVLPAHEALEKIASGEAMVLRARATGEQSEEQAEPEPVLLPAPLLGAGFARQEKQEKQAWGALPLPVELPLLLVNRQRLAERSLRVPDDAHWTDILRLAEQLSDPIGNVHGLCVSPQYRHAVVLRAMLSDAQIPWLDTANGEPFAGSGWLAVAESYARTMARAGPPNAARLSEAEFAQLRKDDLCAMWLAPWDEDALGTEVVAVPVPGAAAFVAPLQHVLLVAAESARATVAADFVWSVTANLQAKMTDSAERTPAALAAMLRQPGAAATQLGQAWDDWDHRAQPALTELIDGLLPAEAALDKILHAPEQN